MKTRVIQDERGGRRTATRTPRNLASRMGRWSATHRKTAILAWFGFVLAAFAIGNALGTKQLDAKKAGAGESGRVESILADHFKQPLGDSVLIQSKTQTVDDPAFRAAIEDVTRTVRALAPVQKVRSPFEDRRDGQISSDRHTALVSLELRTSDQLKAQTLDAPVEKAIAAAAARHPGIAIEQFGVNADKQIDKAIKSDFMKAGAFSIPITLIVLVVAFGALVAAGLPLLLALTAVVGTMGLLALPSRLMPLDADVGVVVLLIGMAVGVDYSLFYLKREREERAAGKDSQSALEAAAATSGRSVLVSGLTVMAAMAGMLFTGDKTFMGFGMATMLVVGVAVVGSLTVLPATLAALGDRVDRLRLPFLRRRDGASSGRMWDAILNRVLRRPLVSMAVSAGLLLALAAPALHLHIAAPGFNTMPQNLSSIKTYNKLQAAFPGSGNGAEVLVRTPDAHSARVTAAITDLQHQALATGQFSAPTSIDYNADGTIALVSIGMHGEGVDRTAVAALDTLRTKVVPATVGKLSGAEIGVGGPTASEHDSNSQMADATPFVFGFVLTLAFVLMLLTFRSIVIAIKAVVLNLLSVGAAYGALVLVFQNGWGKNVLGIDTVPGGVIGFLPIFLFVILFGLSMDYHVFILSRVREAFDRGMTTEDAVAHGIKSTAGVVTSAALVMFGVFSIFGTLQFMFLKEFGVGLAIAVLVDATIVRAVLLPSTMTLLGDWNWYMPRWLEWLPRFSHGEPAGKPDTYGRVPLPITP